MKKVLPWVFMIFTVMAIVAWGVIGLGLSRGEYDFEAFAYLLGGSLVVLFAYLLYRNFARGKCPHCGKPKHAGGEYCPYCGRGRGKD